MSRCRNRISGGIRSIGEGSGMGSGVGRCVAREGMEVVRPEARVVVELARAVVMDVKEVVKKWLEYL